MSNDILSVENIRTSPYDTNRTVPPTPEDLVKLGVQVKSGDVAVTVSTKVKPEIVYAIDRLIEQRVYKMKTRQEFFRLAMMNLIAILEYEIQSDAVQDIVHRLEVERQMVGELHRRRDALSMIALTKRAVDDFLQTGDMVDAIKSLRNAKRFMEQIPYAGLRTKFINALYGSVDGETLPADWRSQTAAKLWDRVLNGELDRDDAEEMAKTMKVF